MSVVKRRTKLFWGGFFLIFVFTVVAFRFYGTPFSVEYRARDIVARCAHAQSRADCYDKEVPALLNQGVSFEDTFAIAEEIQQLDTSGEYCHNIGHRLGATEVAKDPSKWKEVARRTPQGVCLSGGLHGAFQERFKTDFLAPENVPAFLEEIKGFCDFDPRAPSSPTNLFMCSHGLGHLFMFITDGVIERSMSLCAAVQFKDGGGVTQDGQELSCYDGIFMQLFEPHEPEDYALIGINGQTKETVGAFCRSFSGLAEAACVARSAPFFYKTLNEGPPRPLDCGVLEASRRDLCRGTQLRLFARDTYFDMGAADTYCATYPQERRGWCYAAAGSYAFMAGHDYPKAFEYCEHAVTAGVGGQCYETLSTMIPYSFMQEERLRLELCAKLPPPYAQRCVSVRLPSVQ